MEVNGVGKKLNNRPVLLDIRLTVKEQKMTAFIGPNGAGKSTLLSLMSRLLKKDYGEIYLSGRELKTWKNQELAQHLAVLRQSNQTQLKITVEELVAFGRFPYSQGRLTAVDHQKIEEAMSYLGLEEIRHERIQAISGGQLQRAYIALVLAQDTDYILLDEPLNNLDMNYAVQMMKTLRDLVDKQGKTVVIVLHDINFAASYADEIVALKDGQLYAAGSTETIITEATLNELYDMQVRVYEIDGKKVCLYFN